MRGEAEVLAATVYAAPPLPDPLLAPLIVTQDALAAATTALHAQPPVAVIAAFPVPPAETKACVD